MSIFTERDGMHATVVSTVAFMAADRPDLAGAAVGMFAVLETSRLLRETSTVTKRGKDGLLQIVMGKRHRQ